MTEEVRKCVEILRYCDESGGCCGGCPSGKTNGIPNCYSISHIADLIESLSAQLDQVTRERDAAVRMLDGECHACTHNSCGEPSREKEVCRTCLNNEDAWWGYELKDHWQWRGAEKEVEG